MLNYQLPLLALLAANRFGDSPGDAGRAALLAMTIRPQMVGLLVALMVAKQKAPTTVVASNRSASDASSGTFVNALIPRAQRRFCPSFIGLKSRQAEVQASEFGLRTSIHPPEGGGRNLVVVRQVPKEGNDWPRDDQVTLHLGHLKTDLDELDD